MSKVAKAVSWAIAIANDNSHGYSQYNRYGPDFDCSSLVISSWEVGAGVPVKEAGATYTGNMYSAFKKCGFKDVTKTVNLKTGAGLVTGDVLLNTKHHTEMYIGNGKNVGALSSETGGKSGKTGDQTGREITTLNYRNYPWNYVLRYEEKITVNRDGATAFVTNVYKYALNRTPDAVGLDNWVNALCKGTSAESVAHSIVFSPECLNRNLSDKDFVDMLYHALLSRNPDAEGQLNWENALKFGTSRTSIFYAFTRSPEFARYAENLGIISVRP